MLKFNKRILIIDDEPEITSLLHDSLKIEGYDVFSANSGVDGIIQAKRCNPHLIITDIMMPDISGYEVVKILREEFDVPILLLSAKQSETDKVYGLSIGADDFIIKPFSIKELKARILSQFRRLKRENSNTNKRTVVKFEKLHIDFVSQKIYYDSKEISLTNREFEIIKLLCLHPGQTYSREEIYHEVWNEDPFNTSQTVTEHIKKIRKKLHCFHCEKYIKTVWGMGYKWNFN